MTIQSESVIAWVADLGFEVAWEHGTGDARLTGVVRGDGERCIVTNGDPVFEGDVRFAEAWEDGSADSVWNAYGYLEEGSDEREHLGSARTREMACPPTSTHSAQHHQLAASTQYPSEITGAPPSSTHSQAGSFFWRPPPRHTGSSRLHPSTQERDDDNLPPSSTHPLSSFGAEPPRRSALVRRSSIQYPIHSALSELPAQTLWFRALRIRFARRPLRQPEQQVVSRVLLDVLLVPAGLAPELSLAEQQVLV